VFPQVAVAVNFEIGKMCSPVLKVTKNVSVAYPDEILEYAGVDLGHQLSIFVNADYTTSTVVQPLMSSMNEKTVLGS
jgi:hypothetical protein